jgi:uncharacterized protein (DUF3084 family)
MALTLQDKEWTKTAIIDGVVEGINQVVIPVLEGLDKKIDKNAEKIDRNAEKIDKNAEKIDNLEAGLSRVERKLDQVTDHQSEKLDEHEDRLSVLETNARLNVI